MEFSVKHFVRTALLAGVALAGSAHASIAIPSGGNGELFLAVLDTTDNTSYVRGLGVTLDDVLTKSAIGTLGASPAPASPEKTFTFSLPTISADANLTSYLSSHNAANLRWGVYGGATTATGTSAAKVALGAERFVTTSQDHLGVTSTILSSSDLNQQFGALDGYVQSINGTIGGTDLDKSSSTGTDFNGSGLANNWFGTGVAGLNPIGAANLYVATTSGDKNTTASYYLASAQVQFLNGTLSSIGGVAPVPLPAAVYLLGSGLLGLVGVGRRRRSGIA